MTEFLSTFAQDIILIVYKLGDFCSNFFTTICTQTVDEYASGLLDKFDIPLISDVIEFILEDVIAAAVGDLLMIEFFLYGGIVTAVFLSLKKAIF